MEVEGPWVQHGRSEGVKRIGIKRGARGARLQTEQEWVWQEGEVSSFLLSDLCFQWCY